jgi:hypothetical protein
MGGRRIIPLVQLGLLTALSVGALVLGLTRSPPSGDVIMANATANTFGSPLGTESLVMDLTYTVSSGPGGGVLTQVRRINFTAPGHMVVHQTQPSAKLLGTVPANKIVPTLRGYAKVTGGSTTWVAHADRLNRTESLQTFTRRVSAQLSPRGTVQETADIHDGAFVFVHLKVIVPSQTLADGQTVEAEIIGETLQLRSLNGHPVPDVTP